MSYSAITADFDYSIENSGTQILITDTTEYRADGDTPERSDCLVNYLVEYILNGETTDITPNYVAESVTAILVTISNDGWYRITETVTNTPEFGTTFSTQKVENILVTDRLCACLTDKGFDIYTKSTCNCESMKSIQQLAVMQGQFHGVENMVSRNDMNGAAQALERLALNCAALGCGCGC